MKAVSHARIRGAPVGGGLVECGIGDRMRPQSLTQVADRAIGTLASRQHGCMEVLHKLCATRAKAPTRFFLLARTLTPDSSRSIIPHERASPMTTEVVRWPGN